MWPDGDKLINVGRHRWTTQMLKGASCWLMHWTMLRTLTQSPSLTPRPSQVSPFRATNRWCRDVLYAGAMMIALGSSASGTFTNDDRLWEQLNEVKNTRKRELVSVATFFFLGWKHDWGPGVANAPF